MREFRVTDAADQQFTAILGTRRATIRLRYNVTSGRWSVDLSIDETPVLRGRRLVMDTDILAPFNLGIGAIFIASDDAAASPGRDQLPSGAVRMYHATEADIAVARA